MEALAPLADQLALFASGDRFANAGPMAALAALTGPAVCCAPLHLCRKKMTARVLDGPSGFLTLILEASPEQFLFK
ncbi:hypothetical protein [Paenibacillus sp. 1P03SA]|uniref:hypothetical protein n=1 Tax=Paenibacillus sp. 1P03SA TaxID=3132294 RepID=UPI0039A19E64